MHALAILLVKDYSRLPEEYWGKWSNCRENGSVANAGYRSA